MDAEPITIQFFFFFANPDKRTLLKWSSSMRALSKSTVFKLAVEINDVMAFF